MKKRNCAFDKAASHSSPVVWARGEIVSWQCPKSIITGASLHWLETFRLWKLTASGQLWDMNAKDADALLLLSGEAQKEEQNGRF